MAALGLMGLLYPSRGDFLAVAGRFGDMRLVRTVKRALRGAGFPVEALCGPSFIPGVDFSDQRNYWAHGFRAAMITDTAFYRNPHYHQPTDTPETLDYPRLARAAEAIYQAVLAVSEGAPDRPPGS
jgi:hypothetical protein